MIRFHVAIALALAVPFSCINAVGKCATGTVTVQGVVQNLPSNASQPDVTVVLNSRKGDFSKTARLRDSKFTIEVPFSTLKSWSPLTGHSCSNLPKQVEVTIVNAGQVVARKTLSFRENFETKNSFSYALKRELTIDASEQHK